MTRGIDEIDPTAPRRRVDPPLAPGVCEVDHASGTWRGTDDDLIEEIEALSPGGPRNWRPANGVRSVLDDAPALVLRTGDLSIPLTLDQMAGLLGRELRPAEREILFGRYGGFYEIDEDFYDEGTGEPLHPSGLRETLRIVVSRSHPSVA